MNDKERREKFERIFGSKRFDVESSINIYATSFVTLPASGIYESKIIDAYKLQIETCHIYMIGLLPKIDIEDFSQAGETLIVSFRIAGRSHDVEVPLPSGYVLQGDGDTVLWHVVAPDGTKLQPDLEHLIGQLNGSDVIDFEVLYIGQAYGDGGSRNALDRLQKHETLQKIAVKGIPATSVLTLLLLEIAPGNRMITMFNPFAKDTSQGKERINQGMSKLLETTDAERTTLFEASFIRYFEPPYNKEFKNSFPSTNMKLLAECYRKDIAAVTAEINLDGLPFKLFSDKIPARGWHTAHHDLNKEADRRVFFDVFSGEASC